VLVFVGCFIIPFVSCLFKWRYPPLTDEEQLQLNDSKDPVFQSFIQLLEKQAVLVSDMNWKASAAFETSKEPKGGVSDEKGEVSPASFALQQQDNDQRPQSERQVHSCAICLDEYAQTNQVVCATGGCSHYFHKTCMESLIRSRVRKGDYEVVPCPICRLPFFAPTSWNLQLTLGSHMSGNTSSTIASTSGTITDMIAMEDAEGGAALTAASTNVGTTSTTNDGNTSGGETCSTENDFSVPSSSLPTDTESSFLQTTMPSNGRDSTSNSANLKEDLKADDSFVSTSSVIEAPITRVKSKRKRSYKQ